jgi:hypothetical protein
MTLLRSALSLIAVAALSCGGGESTFRSNVPAAVPLASVAPADEKQAWGTSIKGRVIFDGAAPMREKIAKIDNDVAFCTKNGPVLSDALVVDPKTKGVRWCVAYLLAEDGNFKTPLPVNQAAIKALPKSAILDQPCCMFEPHVVVMNSKQTLLAKNSAEVTHNTFIAGSGGNPQINPSIPPKKELEVEGWKATPAPIPVSCSIHKWMTAHIYVFDHTYFAVTNEKGEFEIKNPPAGKFRLMVRTADGLYLAADPGKEPNKMGMAVEIKAGAVTDVGDIKMKPPTP